MLLHRAAARPRHRGLWGLFSSLGIARDDGVPREIRLPRSFRSLPKPSFPHHRWGWCSRRTELPRTIDKAYALNAKQYPEQELVVPMVRVIHDPHHLNRTSTSTLTIDNSTQNLTIEIGRHTIQRSMVSRGPGRECARALSSTTSSPENFPARRLPSARTSPRAP